MRERARSSRSSSKRAPTAHPDNPAQLVVGRVGRAVGLHGEVEVVIVSDYPDRFAPGSEVLTAGDERHLTVRTLRRHGERTIVSFAEVEDRTEAEALRGRELVITAEHARELEADEYWDHDLVGCVVVTTDGDEIGVVTDVLHQPANEVLVVEAERKEVLVPLVADVVKQVEPRSRITIEPPAGLVGDE